MRPNFDFCRLISQVVRSSEMRPNFVFLPFNFFTSSEKQRNVLNFDFLLFNFTSSEKQ